MTPLSPNPASDYAQLRAQGIGLLESMAGPDWTDFNTHDPGITILEQVCYALTDLGYRIDYDIRDLLAGGGADPHRAAPSPAEVLTGNPVTLTDLRKVVMDVEGVINAWIEPMADPGPALFLDPCDGRLYLEPAPHRTPVPVRGVCRVLIERDPGRTELSDLDLRAAVDRRLHECRGLAQDLRPAEVLAEQRIGVNAVVEVDALLDPEQLLAEVYQALGRFISPRVRFYTLDEMLARGLQMDEIMDGPVLRHGFILTAELDGLQRKAGLRTSDLIQVIMNCTGVMAVDEVALATDGVATPWYLKLKSDQTPVLDLEGIALGAITLVRGGMTAHTDPERVRTLYAGLDQAARYGVLAEDARDVRIIPGRDRQVGRYSSIQRQFPAVYGVGDLGLPASAGAPRQAQARQLKAYLLFFDQLLANGFAQLANLHDLFGFATGGPRTYFSQVIDDPGLDLNDLWADATGLAARLARITESAALAGERKNRFLNHLLARFAEDFADWSGARPGPASDLIRAKAVFLQDYAGLGAARGRAFDYRAPAWDTGNVSGLHWRISRKLGLADYGQRSLATLQATDGGGFHLVEHLLLRPRPADLEAMQPGMEAGVWEAGALLALPGQPDQTGRPDPYSQQISCVFPTWVQGCDEEGNGGFIRKTLREETPAHLHLRIHWLGRAAMRVFESAYHEFLDGIRALELQQAGSATLAVRDARDRLIDLLGLGMPYPLRDLQARYDPDQGVIRIASAQAGVSYRLCDDEGDPLSFTADGSRPAVHGELQPPPSVRDLSYRVLASRTHDALARPLPAALDVYLNEPVVVQVPIATGLPVACVAQAGQVVAAGALTIDFGGWVKVAIGGSQAGISYQLVTVCDGIEEPVPGPTQGTGDTIELHSGVLREDSTIAVHAFRTRDPRIKESLTTSLTVKVRPNPGVTIESGKVPAVIAYRAQTRLSLCGAQASTDYQLWKRQLVLGDYSAPVSGDPMEVARRITARDLGQGFDLVGTFKEEGGTLSRDTDTLLEDTLFIVRAIKQGNRETLSLSQVLVVLVEPNTQVQVESTPGVWLSGTQKGVRYQLCLPDGTAVNTPGYHWEDRGIAAMRVGVDLVVGARDPGAVHDHDLELPAGPLAAATQFNIRATKRLTGVSVLLERSVTIDPAQGPPG